jgi:hypothetical protein
MEDVLLFEIAGIMFRIRSSTPLAIRNISPVYRQFITTSGKAPVGPVVEIGLETGDLPDTRSIKKIFDSEQSWAMYSDGTDYFLEVKPPDFHEPLWVATCRESCREITVYCSNSSLACGENGTSVLNPFSYPLDQIMLVYILSQEQGALFHAAGMRMQNRAFIFPGRSGAGKSTLSRLLLDRDRGELLSDDRVIVRKIDNAFTAFGTPWPGDAGIAENKNAQLAGIFFIYHAHENLIKDLTPQEAMRSLLPVASIPWYDEKPLSAILSLCEDLVYSVPAYALHFRPDRSAGDLLEEFLGASFR